MEPYNITTSHAPQAIGPYSQAIVAKPWVYCSGQIPLNPETQQIIEGTIEEQTQQVLQNLSAVLKAAGSDLSKVVKTTIFLTDLEMFQKVNTIYQKFFHDPHPARSTIQVSALPLGALIEVEAIAIC